MNILIDPLRKAFNMTKHERIMRVIALTCKKENGFQLEFEEELELNAIQTVREMNGELAEVRRNQVID